MTSETSAVLNRVAAELFIRSARLKHCLREPRYGDLKQCQPLADTVSLALEKIDALLLEILNVGSESEELDFSHLLRHLGKVTEWFLSLHMKFLVYLPREPVLPETIYAIHDSFGDLFAKEPPSILLDTYFSAAEFDFLKELKRQMPVLEETSLKALKNVVLLLPVCDSQSPEAWAILAHEMGHAIDSQRKFSAEVIDELNLGDPESDSGTYARWCRELSADLIAARVLGPSPALALTSLSFCLYPLTRLYFDKELYKSHPPTRWRLKVISKYLAETTNGGTYADFLGKESEFFDQAYRVQLRALVPVSQQKAIESEDRQRFEDIVSPIVGRLVEKVSSVTAVCPSLDRDSIDRCVSRLKKNQPIGAQGADRTGLRGAILYYRSDTASRRMRYFQLKSRFRALLEKFKEAPLDIAPILLSGHLVKLEIIAKFSEKSHDPVDDLAVSAMCNELAEIDDKLVGSIRSSGVHKHLLKRRNREKPLSIESQEFTYGVRSPASSIRREAGILSDIEILERVVAKPGDCVFISPLIDPVEQLGPSSLDLRLGTELQVSKNVLLTHIDLLNGKDDIKKQEKSSVTRWQIGPDGFFVLHPGEFALASTLEYICLPKDVAGRLEGRSTWGRLGLQVHATAGFVDPGFEGTLTFELINSGKLPIKLFPGLRLGQICFFRVHEVQLGYMKKEHSKYGGHMGVVGSQVHLEPEIGD